MTIYENDPWRFEESLKLIHYFNCLISRNLFYILTLSLPEMVMYGLTFKSIVSHTNFLAVNGLLQPEKIKKRKKKNLVNIYMTFRAWLGVNFTNILRAAFSYESSAWSFFVLRFRVCTFWRKNIGTKAACNMLVKLTIVQLFSNICLMVLVKIFYSKSQFLFNLFGLLSLCLSFNILPFLYIVMASEKHKWKLNTSLWRKNKVTPNTFNIFNYWIVGFNKCKKCF